MIRDPENMISKVKLHESRGKKTRKERRNDNNLQIRIYKKSGCKEEGNTLLAMSQKDTRQVMSLNCHQEDSKQARGRIVTTGIDFWESL